MIARFRLLAKENWTNLYEIVLASSIMNVLRHGMLVVLATELFVQATLPVTPC